MTSQPPRALGISIGVHSAAEPGIGLLGTGAGHIENMSDVVDGLIGSSDFHDAVSDDWSKLFF
jgi:hypothetical protein